MLKTILIAILTLCNISHCVDDASATVEMYPDEKPKLFLYKEGVFEKGEEFLSPLDYSIAKGMCSYGRSYYDTYSLYLPDDEDTLNHPVFVRNIRTKGKIDISEFMENEQEVSVGDSFFKPNKWSIPRYVSPYSGYKININHLSWRYVDAFFSSPSYSYFLKSAPENLTLDNLYKEIDSKGIPSCITRWLMIHNKKNYQIYFAYNSDNELQNIPKIEPYII